MTGFSFHASVVAVPIAFALSSVGCTTVFMQDDGFRTKLKKGCATEKDCQALLAEAHERVSKCKSNTIGYVKCEDARADQKTAVKLLTPHIEARLREERAREEQRLAEARAKEESAQQESEARAEALRRAKAEREAAEAARKEVLFQKAQQAKFAVPVISAMVCEKQEELRLLEGDLRREQRLTKRSGVMDLKERRDIAEEMESVEEEIGQLKATLREEHKASAVPCGKQYKQIKECQGKHQFQRCEEPLGTYVDILNEGLYR